ncbi:hypothetical protein CAAN1_04S04346 [[Candida] anglica]|uniref:Uncharacterized protein n=1 Tax=[Candida] anglica TaxID=148631 RepID=A0ABP0EDA5_9ASCO
MKFATTLTIASTLSMVQGLAFENVEKRATTDQVAGAESALGILGLIGAAGSETGLSADAAPSTAAAAGAGFTGSDAGIYASIGAALTEGSNTATAAAIGGALTTGSPAGGANSAFYASLAQQLDSSATSYAIATSSAATSGSSGYGSSYGGFLASILGDIDFESVAGYADNILSENSQYLDDALVWLKDTGLLPKATLYLLESNFSSPLVSSIVSGALNEVSALNTTSFFVALDQSGLFYQIISSFIIDPDLLPAGLSIVKKLIAEGGISFSEIIAAAGRLVKKDEFSVEQFELPELARRTFEDALLEDLETRDDSDHIFWELDIQKRDNIENLLTTVFTSVEKSDILNSTIHTLLIDPQFQDAAVTLLSGTFKKFATGSGYPSNLSFLGPILAGIVESGLLQNTFERALADPALRAALIADLGAVLRSGAATVGDFVSGKDIVMYQLALKGIIPDSLEVKAATSGVSSVIGAISSTLATVASSAESSVASSIVSSSSPSATPKTTSSGNSGVSTTSSGFLALVAGLCGYIMIL